MSIPESEFASVRALNVDDHRTFLTYQYWETRFSSNAFLRDEIARIKRDLGDGVTRSDIVQFYRRENLNSETKFIAAMLWGHGAAAGGQRDKRGPWKVEQMFARQVEAIQAIRSVSVETSEQITCSYSRLNRDIDRCGPNFFTKHFYFLGKSLNLDRYPLIFDDRVARGLVKTTSRDPAILRMVKIGALTKPRAYLSYLDFAQEQAECIGCSLEQIEYYLFRL